MYKFQKDKRNMEVDIIQMEATLKLSIAPMIDVTNTHFRYFMRLLTKKAILYTEMVHHDAIIHSHQWLLPFSPEEHPIVLQLGGCDPDKLAEAAIIAQQYGYDQINLNVGCPSPKVQRGAFGACLMKEADLVRRCMQTMKKAVAGKNCTIKCRLGVDDFDSYQFVRDFVREVSNNQEGPIRHFIIHARKALLKGLNPHQNRTIPPLQYEKVYRLKNDFPLLTFEINGGIKTIYQGFRLVKDNDLAGCMIGRASYQNPFEMIKIDEIFYGEPSYKQRFKGLDDWDIRGEILEKYADYVERLGKGEIKDAWGRNIRKPNPSVLVKPLINLFHGEQNCAKFRNFLSDHTQLKKEPVQTTIRKSWIYMKQLIAAQLMQKKSHQQQKIVKVIKIQQNDMKQEDQQLIEESIE